LHVLDLESAVNGCPGVAFVDKLNRNTSMGNPWRKSKKHFLVPSTDERFQDPVEFIPEIVERIDEIEKTYIGGSCVAPNFCAHLKDEAVSFAKAEKGKTRVFTASPADWSVVVRKYALTFVKLLQENKFVFESAPGTICQSSEWTDIFTYLTQFGEDRIVAGDFKAFDKRMPAMFMQEAFRIIGAICKASGNYDDDDLRVLHGIGLDTAFPLVDFNGDLVQFFGSNPSGHPLTVIVNGLCNSLYMRYCYSLANPLHEVDSFRSNVALITYGDDNIMGVSSEITWFDHTVLQDALLSIDVIYTMADKNAESVPFISIHDAGFLKRSWRYEADIDGYAAPLDHDSIEKSLMTWVKSKEVCPEEQAIDVISSAIREYFFYGEDTFKAKSKMFRLLIDKLNLNDFECDTTLPTWEDMVSRWKENSRLLASVSKIGLVRTDLKF
jgi:hypothetical protein